MLHQYAPFCSLYTVNVSDIPDRKRLTSPATNAHCHLPIQMSTHGLWLTFVSGIVCTMKEEEEQAHHLPARQAATRQRRQTGRTLLFYTAATCLPFLWLKTLVYALFLCKVPGQACHPACGGQANRLTDFFISITIPAGVTGFPAGVPTPDLVCRLRTPATSMLNSPVSAYV